MLYDKWNQELEQTTGVESSAFLFLTFFFNKIQIFIPNFRFLVKKKLKISINNPVISSYDAITYTVKYNCRLITAYLLLQVNLDKIMHVRWDFDASSARRVSALDKHQNWSVSALVCLNSQAQSKYAVVDLIHTQRKQTFWLLLCDK